MIPWKMIAAVVLLLLPGGSLVLLGVAAAKALRAVRSRLLSRAPLPVPAAPARGIAHGAGVLEQEEN